MLILLHAILTTVCRLDRVTYIPKQVPAKPVYLLRRVVVGVFVKLRLGCVAFTRSPSVHGGGYQVSQRSGVECNSLNGSLSGILVMDANRKVGILSSICQRMEMFSTRARLSWRC